jgi:hypothetical protein
LDWPPSEVAGMRDTLDTYAAKLPMWGWLQRYIAAKNWERKCATSAMTRPSIPP